MRLASVGAEGVAVGPEALADEGAAVALEALAVDERLVEAERDLGAGAAVRDEVRVDAVVVVEVPEGADEGAGGDHDLPPLADEGVEPFHERAFRVGRGVVVRRGRRDGHGLPLRPLADEHVGPGGFGRPLFGGGAEGAGRDGALELVGELRREEHPAAQSAAPRSELRLDRIADDDGRPPVRGLGVEDAGPFDDKGAAGPPGA